MDISINIERKQINPAVINLRQHSNDTDVLTFLMPEYVTETTDLSTLDAYAVCDLGGSAGIDKVKLESAVVEGGLRITWKVTGYTTQEDGHVTYHIVFCRPTDDPEANPVWYSYAAIILVNSTIDADSYIAARYPSILQQWEKRMNDIDAGSGVIVELAEEVQKEAAIVKGIADKSENALEAINELIGYEPLPDDIVGREVAEARGEHSYLGKRLDAMGFGINLVEGNSIRVEVKKDTAAAVALTGKTYQNGNPSPTAPVSITGIGEGGSIKVQSVGKNLLHYPYEYGSSNLKGITYAVGKDGTVVASGTAEAGSYYTLHSAVGLNHLEVGKKYTLSGCPEGGGTSSYCLFAFNPNGEGSYIFDSGDGVTFEYLNDDVGIASTFYIGIFVQSGVTVENLMFKPQLEEGETATEFETGRLSEMTYKTSTSYPLFEGDVLKVNGDVTRKMNRVVLDGTTNKVQMVDDEVGHLFCAIYTDMNIQEFDVKCSHFSKLNSTSEITTKDGMLYSEYWGMYGLIGFSLGASHPEFTTTDEFNAWLAEQHAAGTPVTLVYSLKAPVEEHLTRTGELMLQEGVNHVCVTDGSYVKADFELLYNPEGLPMLNWLYAQPYPNMMRVDAIKSGSIVDLGDESYASITLYTLDVDATLGGAHVGRRRILIKSDLSIFVPESANGVTLPEYLSFEFVLGTLDNEAGFFYAMGDKAITVTAVLNDGSMAIRHGYMKVTDSVARLNVTIMLNEQIENLSGGKNVVIYA